MIWSNGQDNIQASTGSYNTPSSIQAGIKSPDPVYIIMKCLSSAPLMYNLLYKISRAIDQGLLYLSVCLIRALLLDEGGNHNQVSKFSPMRSNKQCAQLASLCLEKGGFENSEANTGLVIKQSRLSFPVNFLFPNLEEGVAVEERDGVMDVLQLDGLVSAGGGHCDLRCPILSEELSRTRNDGAGFVSFVDLNMVCGISFAIISDILFVLPVFSQAQGGKYFLSGFLAETVQGVFFARLAIYFENSLSDGARGCHFPSLKRRLSKSVGFPPRVFIDPHISPTENRSGTGSDKVPRKGKGGCVAAHAQALPAAAGRADPSGSCGSRRFRIIGWTA